MATNRADARGLVRPTRGLIHGALGGTVAVTLLIGPLLLRMSPTEAQMAAPVAAVGIGTSESAALEPDEPVRVAPEPAPPVPVTAATAVPVSSAVPATPVTTRNPRPPAPPPAPLPAALPTPLQVAQAEVDGPEARYTTGWGFTPGYWCAKFISWVLAHAGVALRDDGPGALLASVPAVETPAPGDLVFIDLMPERGTGQVSHVGIVESVNGDGSVATIEGNAGPSAVVTRQVRQGAEIVGFGRVPAATSTAVIPAPPAPVEVCVWIEIGKPWLCDWKPMV